MFDPARRRSLGTIITLGTGFGMTMGTGLGLSALALPRAERAKSAVAVPAGPLNLTRRITRSLHDGREIVVERIWQVNFAHQAQGIAVNGAQSHVRVDAPDVLEPIANIEQNRSTADMWPVLLTGSGLIIAAGDGVMPHDISHAVRVAGEMIANRETPVARQRQEMALLADLARAGTSLLDRLPDDLFFPAIGPIHQQRSLDLPGGLKGEFELWYEAVAVPGKGWLKHARRRIVTRLAGTQQSADEDWSLSPA